MNKKELIILCLTLAFSLNLNIARSQPVLEVEGIIKDNKTKPYALVNGKIVKEGEEVDGAKVIEVKNDSVKFQYEDNIIVKKIGESNGTGKDKNNTALELYKSRMDEINDYNKKKEEQQKQYSIQKAKEETQQKQRDAELEKEARTADKGARAAEKEAISVESKKQATEEAREELRHKYDKEAAAIRRDEENHQEIQQIKRDIEQKEIDREAARRSIWGR